MKQTLTVALVGNPNSGKTTIFNNLTGARQHVGNYPGVTVESKEGTCRYNGTEIKFVDLPGTYSLTAYSADELVARRFIIHEKPDVIVDIIDSSNLERNLYLTVQLMELGVPLVLAFNMSDQAGKRGFAIDTDKLSTLLDAPIVSTVGHKGKGMNELLEAVVASAESAPKEREPFTLDYGREVEEEITNITSLLGKNGSLPEEYDPRWLATKLLENDRDVASMIGSPKVNDQVDKSAARIEKIVGEHPETSIAGSRYGYISGACQESVRSTIEIRHTISDKIDTVVVNRILGIPIFLGLMYLVFQLTFTLGGPFMDWLDQFFGWLGVTVAGWWPVGS